MTIHKEIAFEEEICEYLGSHGWVYVEGDASKYDRGRALFPDDVLAWVQTTQPAGWEALVKNHGSQAGETLLTRLRDSMNQRGTLDVLRQGIEMLGVKGKLPLAQFKPALAINPEIQARYEQNRLRVLSYNRKSCSVEEKEKGGVSCCDLFTNSSPRRAERIRHHARFYGSRFELSIG